MSIAIVMSETGGPEVLRPVDHDPGAPGPGEVRVRHAAIGLNFIDVYHRTGGYPLPLPATPGLEGAGTVVAVGADVTSFRVGDRIAYAGGPAGAYASERLIPADRIVALPDSLSFEQGAAMMLQGLTAEYLLRRTFPISAGDRLLIHAAAGGVGQIVCQWAKHLGATVLGTVGSPAKAEIARAKGCDHPILYRDEDFVAKVRALTDGDGVDVVYDSVGRDTFLGSLDCLRPRGMLVSFGQSSGPIDTFNPALLAQKGSLFLTRPSLFHYIAKPEELAEAAAALFAVVESGALTIEIGARYPLAEVARAHADLEARKTTGSVILIP